MSARDRTRARERINVTVDPAALERARRYSQATGRSVSSLVSDFLGGLPDPDGEAFAELDPELRELHGVLGGRGSLQDWSDHLLERHLRRSLGGEG